jgi:hypothetical protein
MIAGVSSLLYYGGCELALISSVTIPSLLHLQSSLAGLLSPGYENKSFGPYLIFFP